MRAQHQKTRRTANSLEKLSTLDVLCLPAIPVKPWLHLALFLALLCLFKVNARAQTGTVKAHQKISGTAGTFAEILDDEDRFGWDVTSLGDLDGDGVTDIAVATNSDDDGGLDRGAIWLLFLHNDGSVKTRQKISMT